MTQVPGNVKYEADDNSGHVQEAHAGANEKKYDQWAMENVQISFVVHFVV